jgi:hypothetical protein
LIEDQIQEAYFRNHKVRSKGFKNRKNSCAMVSIPLRKNIVSGEIGLQVISFRGAIKF